MEEADSKPTIGLAGLVVSVALCSAIGILSAFISNSGPSEWYDGLAKSALNPPPVVFAIVWPTLYALMGISLWLMLREAKTRQSQAALLLFAIQLAINVTWSWVFFDRHWLGVGVIHIAVLWLAIAGFMAAARKVAPWAAYLNLPYLLWVTFAFYLSYSIWQLNSQQ